MELFLFSISWRIQWTNISPPKAGAVVGLGICLQDRDLSKFFFHITTVGSLLLVESIWNHCDIDYKDAYESPFLAVSAQQDCIICEFKMIRVDAVDAYSLFFHSILSSFPTPLPVIKTKKYYRSWLIFYEFCFFGNNSSINSKFLRVNTVHKYILA